jgi:hypothetical protein
MTEVGAAASCSMWKQDMRSMSAYVGDFAEADRASDSRKHGFTCMADCIHYGFCEVFGSVEVEVEAVGEGLEVGGVGRCRGQR